MLYEVGESIQGSRYTIRTSDRRTFRRCRRKWGHMSSLRGNWKHKGTEQNINFWFGSAIHFAMEDYFGWNKFKDPRRAFHAYYNAFPAEELPSGAAQHYELGMNMLSYFLTWYEKHNKNSEFETAWFYPDLEPALPFAEGASPGIEFSFILPLDVWVAVDKGGEVVETFWDKEDVPSETEYMLHGELLTVKPVMYHGTMDRIVVDRLGRYWILDWKTAKGADTNKLDTDDQVSSYLWAASKIFKVPFYGFIYVQLTKDSVQEPKRLKNGELSVDKKQKTTYSLLKQELLKDYEHMYNVPPKLIQFLNVLAEGESPEGDRFIRWDFIKRTPMQLKMTERYIMSELRDMLNMDNILYPSPTRDCIWDCPIRDICLNTDKGEDEEIALELNNWEQRPREEDGNIEPWRENLKYPESDDDLIPLEDILQLEQCMTIQLDSRAYEEETTFTFLYEEK